MKKPVERFFIVAERNNPQLGTYLSNVYVGKRRNNKTTLTCTFDYYGSSKSLRFSFCANTADGIHYCLNGGDCVYGSMSYFGFATQDKAKAYLDKNWAGHRNYESCCEKLASNS